MVLVDGQGLPLGVRLESASPGEATLAEATLKEVRVPGSVSSDDSWSGMSSCLPPIARSSTSLASGLHSGGVYETASNVSETLAKGCST